MPSRELSRDLAGKELQDWTPFENEVRRSWEDMKQQVCWAQSLGEKLVLQQGFHKFEEVSDGIRKFRNKLLEDHRQLTQKLVHQFQEMRLALREATLPPKKRRFPEAVRNSSIISVHDEDCKEQIIWKEELVKPNVPRQIVSLDDLLDSPRHLVADLRWLHFLLYEAKEVELTDVLKMRKSRNKGQNDKELEYHPLLLKFMEASAGGQPEVEFLKEVHVGAEREDLSSSILGGKFNEAHEVKAAFSLAVSGKPETGIEKNAAGFSKIYKSNKKYSGPPCHLGIFGVRCEYVWFARFRYEQDGSKVVSCDVAPEFPCGRVWGSSNLLCDLTCLDTVEEGSNLIDICSAVPFGGFELLVRYVDSLCTLYNTPKALLRLARNDCDESIDLSTASIVGQGYKSVVLRLRGEECVIKVSDPSRIDREAFIHERVDGAPYVRPQRKGLHWRGQVLGAGDGLEWMVLAGFGRPVTSDDVSNNFELLWKQASEALVGLHSRGVLHRDVKPSNMLIFCGSELWLNDFDASCLVDDSLQIRKQRVGAPYFESPLFDEGEGFLYRDDWYSLVLSFLDLRGWYKDGDDKISILTAAERGAHFPSCFHECVKWLLGGGYECFQLFACFCGVAAQPKPEPLEP